MKRFNLIALIVVALIGSGIAVAIAFPDSLAVLTSGQLVRIYYANDPGSTQGYATVPVVLGGPYPTSTTASTTVTFTNSPCTVASSSPQWVPVTIVGQTGTWYIPACH